MQLIDFYASKHRLYISVQLCLILVASIAAEDLPCLDKALRQIEVSSANSNPYKIIASLRDSVGYGTGLRCQWNLKIANGSGPVQLLLNVTAVDFDRWKDGAQSDAECPSRSSDIFSLEFKGPVSTGTGFLRHLKWCRNSTALAAGEIIVLSMVNSTTDLSVNFTSDDYETRSNSRGIEVEAITMKPAYCERNLLYHDGWCYFVTLGRLSHGEAWNQSRSATGELAAFGSPADLQAVINSNIHRKVSLYPFLSPLDLHGQDLWTGNYYMGGKGEVHAVNSSSGCGSVPVQGFNVSCNQSSCDSKRGACALLLRGGASLVCAPASTRLPALMRFPLLAKPAQVCPDPLLTAAARRSTESGPTDAQLLHPAVIVGIVLFLLAVAGVVIALIVLRVRRQEMQQMAPLAAASSSLLEARS